MHILWLDFFFFFKKSSFGKRKCLCNMFRPRGYKEIFMLISAEHEFFPAHKCQNANNCWHCNIYEQEISILGFSKSEKN